MKTIPETGLRLLCAFAALAFAGAAQAQVKAVYTVVQLSPEFQGGAINGKGQVAFTEANGTATRAKFYDGERVRDLGTLGGALATAADVNDLGQVTGDSTVDAEGTVTHAYRWSAATGMVDLSKPGYGQSHGIAINNKGQVAGYNEFSNPSIGHGFFWSPQTGMLDVGALGPYGSIAYVINDAGVVAGASEGPQGGPFSLLAFRWNRSEGIHGIGTLPSEFTFADDINAARHIVGESPFTPGGEPHAFLWTQRDGLLDLGTGSLNRSIAFAINDHDMVVGQALVQFVGPVVGFVWTRETGMIELRSQSPNVVASANDVNNRGQVVGTIDNHAFVWTRADGVVDLNRRLRSVPEGLTLMSAFAISDNGAILAQANTGLVLLVPRCGCAHAAPLVGELKSAGAPRTGALLSFSAAFEDIEANDTHKASWSWGDGGTDAAIVNEKNAAGSASGQHSYDAAGIYTVTLTVTDSSGKSTAVRRKLAVGDADAGLGWLTPPPHAIGKARSWTKAH